MARRTLTRIVRKLAALPFVVAGRLFRFVGDWCRPTYCEAFGDKRLRPLLRSGFSTSGPGLEERYLRASTDLYLRHCYDLLGSGWTTVKYGMQCRGLHGFRYPKTHPVDSDPAGEWLVGRVNPGNLSRAQSIWRLVDREYVPIDWQIDFKSGYRWSERRWYLYIPFKEGGGVDVKVPWELARMQHLAQLARAFAFARQDHTGFRDSVVYMREFRNQVLDFCATNPPRFGVNWRCTMDVAIRVANWVLAYELFRIHGAEFDPEFEEVLLASVYDHADYIVENLEWFEHGRGNHYLANLSGLIFAAPFLPRTDRTDGWLAFAAEELVKEVEHQFHPDGAGAEASTAYHCLCAEMVAYASAVLLGLPDSLKAVVESKVTSVNDSISAPDELLFPGWYTERVEKMAEFVMLISKPGNTIPQVGDNDSGRFFSVFPSFHERTVANTKRIFGHLEDFIEMGEGEPYFIMDHLDRRHVIASINGLFRRQDFDRFASQLRGETQLIAALADGRTLKSYHDEESSPAASRVNIGTEDQRRLLLDAWERMPSTRRAQFEFRPEGEDHANQCATYGFPDFGLYILRSSHIYLSVRCGPMGKNVIGAHAHNDQLSLELNLDGEDVITDPGTYMYMPIPDIRNQYRSVTAHFAPQGFDFEPSRLNDHLFYLDYANEGECLYFGPSGFVGQHRAENFAFFRSVSLVDGGVTVRDWSTTHDLVPLKDLVPPAFSPGYGMRLTPTISALRYRAALRNVRS